MLGSEFHCNFGFSTVSGVGHGSSSTTSTTLTSSDTCEGRKHYLLIASNSELSSFAQACVWTSTLLALPLLPSECNATDELQQT
ncbi:uncharacterized protein DS421_3g83620 [Arachis hypogaea]|nr:uncharacterized protein DS421_3g83620 [Arachis hypogaea]